MRRITFFSVMILFSLLTVSCFDKSKPNDHGNNVRLVISQGAARIEHHLQKLVIE